jgi:bifunctional aspartokinase / homoserine dehydrogenase 1
MPRSKKRGAAVFKFGGTSVGSVEAIRLAAGHVQEHKPAVVVVSAMRGVTDLLLDAGRHALAGHRERFLEAVDAFGTRHIDLVRHLIDTRRSTSQLESEIDRMVERLTAIGESVLTLRELTTRTEDALVGQGERILARIFAALLKEKGTDAIYVDATEVIAVHRRLGGLWPDLVQCSMNAAKKIAPHVAAGRVVVMPGFIGRGESGELITLGRGGSDLSATILARSIGAASVTLWKEVDGLMTADPRSVTDARVIPELHYREAAELAYYGASVLHPRTMIPLIEQAIPLYVRNTFNPSFSGTRIAGDVKPGSYPVKALTAIRGQALLSLTGNGMLGVPGVASRTFAALSEAGHSVSMISQASSESSICLVLPEREVADAVRALRRAFAAEIETRLIDAIDVERHVALVAVVGLGMRGAPGIAARTFQAIGRQRINILAIAQGSSELNITVAINDEDVPRALISLHREYQLDRIRPLAHIQGREIDVTLLGFGQIGRTLARQMTTQQSFFRHDVGLELKCIALADRSGIRVATKGFSADALAELASRKETSGSLLARKGKLTVDGVTRAFRSKLWPLPQYRPVLVDLTADETFPLLLEAVQHRFHLVLANKKPLAVPQKDFDELMRAAEQEDVSVRYEATVGAGLPILDTLRKLEEAGDRPISVLGCLSGTIGYVMTQIDEGLPYSQAVRQAFDLGYTEPDPREDLSGMDVARKALILARTLGHRLDMTDIALEPLFPAELSDSDPKRFIDGLAALDGELAQRLRIARRNKQVLRYVARITPDGIRVGIEAVPENSPIGRLHGTDNQIVLHTKRYKTNPLVVTGPGAGAEVTAAGVLNDIVAIGTGS